MRSQWCRLSCLMNILMPIWVAGIFLFGGHGSSLAAEPGSKDPAANTTSGGNPTRNPAYPSTMTVSFQAGTLIKIFC
jgi:hypothetical protein